MDAPMILYPRPVSIAKMLELIEMVLAFSDFK